MKVYADRIKQLRTSRKLSQEEFAARLGISRSAVGMYETGKREPDLEMCEAIADFFNIDMDYLTGRSDVERRNPITPPPVAKPASEITFDDFTYALHNELGALTDENKAKLLEMAKFFKQQQDLQNNE